MTQGNGTSKIGEKRCPLLNDNDSSEADRREAERSNDNNSDPDFLSLSTKRKQMEQALDFIIRYYKERDDETCLALDDLGRTIDHLVMVTMLLYMGMSKLIEIQLNNEDRDNKGRNNDTVNDISDILKHLYS